MQRQDRGLLDGLDGGQEFGIKELKADEIHLIAGGGNHMVDDEALPALRRGHLERNAAAFEFCGVDLGSKVECHATDDLILHKPTRSWSERFAHCGETQLFGQQMKQVRRVSIEEEFPARSYTGQRPPDALSEGARLAGGRRMKTNDGLASDELYRGACLVN